MRGDLESLREELLDASLIIDSQGLVQGYGHVSARIPDRNAMLMTPRRAPGLLTEGDEMLVVDFDGTLLSGDGALAIEVFLHAEIYRARSDVAAIVRTHSRYANVLGILGRRPRVVHGFGSFLGAEVPIFGKPFLVSTPEIGREVAGTLAGHNAVLLRGNGNAVVGASVPEATVRAIFLEESCELQYLALCAGDPTYFSADEVAARREPGYDHIGRAWDYFRERLYIDSDFEE